MSENTHDNMFDVIQMNEVGGSGKVEAASVGDPSYTGDTIAKKGLLERAMDAVEGLEEDSDETYNLEQLMSPKSGREETKKLRSAGYTTRVYVFTISSDEEDSDTEKYEEVLDDCLSGKRLLVREEWYDLKGREAIKVMVKVLVPNKKDVV